MTTRRNTLRATISKTKGKLSKAQTENKRNEVRQKMAKPEVELIGMEMQLKASQA